MNQPEQMEFFFEIFDASLPRLGPGDDASTRKALNTLLSSKPQRKDAPGFSKLRILDIGCGNGAQTLQLAKHLDGTIVAVDFHQPFLDELNRRAKAAGVADKIKTCLKDMSDLTPDDGRFDLIWSEGALNLMGFSEGVLNPAGFHDGLALCHRLLEPTGFLAVSELGWLRPDPPSECQQFFSTAYPAMAAVEANLSLMKSCGFEVIGHFTLPEAAWWEPYLYPLENRLRSFRERYAGDREKLDFIESVRMQIDIYRKYSSYYGNVFYCMQRG